MSIVEKLRNSIDSGKTFCLPKIVIGDMGPKRGEYVAQNFCEMLT